MKLDEYVESIRKPGESTKAVVKRLVQKTNQQVSMSTIYNVLNGAKIKMYQKAVALSQATGGRVKAKELLE